MSEPLCYITTSSGASFNLTSMCEGKQSSQLQSTAQSDLYLQNVTTHFKEDDSEFKRVISGSVINNSLNTHFTAKLEYQTYKMVERRLIKDKSDSESLATGHGITSGESVDFNFEIPASSDVIVLKVQSDKFRGEPICFADTSEKEDFCKELTSQIRRF
ncbi:MAG: hypothetical protein HWQ38_07835 [Nostoc sp. NMS7]|nr:hypothetical protein [Nostoc sp. NMS7]